MKKTLKRLQSTTANDAAATAILNDNFTSLEEAIENSISRNGAAPNYMQANLDMNGHRIINTADPVDDGDVVTYKTIKEGFVAAARAEQAAATAQSYANQASISAQSSGISAITASNSAQLSKDWANKTDGTVDGEEYSAKHYAQEAEDIAYAVGNPANKDLSNITQEGVDNIREAAVMDADKVIKFYEWRQGLSNIVYTKERDPEVGGDFYTRSGSDYVLSEYKIASVTTSQGHVASIATEVNPQIYYNFRNGYYVYEYLTDIAPSQNAVHEAYATRSLANLTDAGKANAALLLCPSNSASDVQSYSLPASGYEFVAPKTGWVRVVAAGVTNGPGDAYLRVVSNEVAYNDWLYLIDQNTVGSLNVSIPVATGDTVLVGHNLSSYSYSAGDSALKFIKARGG